MTPDGRPVYLFSGDRYWNNRGLTRRILETLPKNSIIVHGAAPGLDSIAGTEAKKLNLEVREYPAHWGHSDDCPPACPKISGKAAGVMRNQQMLDVEHPDKVFAFHNNIVESRGTRDMVKRTIKSKIPYQLFNTLGKEYRLE